MSRPPSIRLETERLILRPFEVGDFDDVHEYASDAEVTRYQSWGPNDESSTREFLERSRAALEEPSPVDYEFAIVDRSTSRVIGGCGVHVRRKPFREFEIGWTLHKANWRRGFGTEAVSSLVEYAFERLGAHRLYALIDSRNEASIALARKLAFVQEGHQRLDSLIQGEWRDTLIFARLE